MSRAKNRHRPWLWVLSGSLTSLLGLTMALASISVWSERDDYAAAMPCEDGPAEGCVTDTTAVVERTRVRRRRADDYLVWLRLDRPELARPRAGVAVELPKPDDVFGRLSPGRPVNVRIWDGHVARIEVPGVAAAETEHSPLTDSIELTLVGVGALAAGAFGLWGGVTMGRSHGWRRAEDAPLRGELGRGLGRVLVALLAGAFAAYLLIVALDVYHPAALLAMPGAALPAWWLLGVRRRRRR